MSYPEVKIDILAGSEYLKAFMNIPYGAPENGFRITVLEPGRKRFVETTSEFVVMQNTNLCIAAGMFREGVNPAVAKLHTEYGLTAGFELKHEGAVPILLDDLSFRFTRLGSLSTGFDRGLYIENSRERRFLSGLLKNGVQIRQSDTSLSPGMEAFLRTLQ